jgi:uncharacterized protein YjbI with pentapeptide repeats
LIERIQQKEKDYLKESFNRIAFEIFPSLLEKDFIVTPLEGKKEALDRPLIFFAQLWDILKVIQEHKHTEYKRQSIIKKWNRNEKIKFSKFIEVYCLSEKLRQSFHVNFNLKFEDFSNLELSRISYVFVNLSYSSLKNIRMYESNLSRATLKEADLTNSSLVGANLIMVDASNAKFIAASLDYANLVMAELKGANLTKASLKSANLTGADLLKANLSGVNLQRANLIGANLTDANLEGADLRGALFDIEQIKRAKNWDKAIYDPEVREKLGLP